MYSLVLLVLLTFLVKNVILTPPLQLNPQILTFPLPEFDLPSKVFSSFKSRLPTAVVPSHYKLDITPILNPTDNEFLTAPGQVTITVTCVEPTNSITLHIFEIVVGDVKVTHFGETGDEVSISIQIEDPINQTLTLSLNENLTLGEEYLVSIHFVSRVATDRFDGLYLSQYTDQTTGIINYQAATQFQAIGARRAFPCFDEPALRATFEIRLGREEKYKTLCNMESTESIEQEEREGYMWDIYPTTSVSMPTYLLAIVVSDFKKVTASSDLYRKPVNVWGPIPNMDSSDGGVFAANTGASMLTFFEEYFDFEYELPKMDSVALPVFTGGAMENWGLVLFRIPYLLYTEGESTQLDRWNIVSVLGHEFAHQWFGNTVTMRWWNDVWLSEGFANYFQFVAAEGTIPEYQPLQRIAMDSSHAGLEFDGSAASEPVHSEDEINVSIGPSRIVYQKGSSLIRMMQGFLTEEKLIQGLQGYLIALKYSSATQDDLFHHLQEVGPPLPEGMTVKQIMDTWTKQAGLPLIRISRAGTNQILISQERFANSPDLILEPHTWYVPIPYTTKSSSNVTTESLQPKLWIQRDQPLILHSVISTDEWIFVNPDAKCHYRVVYDDHFINLLKQQLIENHMELTALSRAQLLDDYFKSAYGEYISLDKALELTEFLYMDDSLPVWTAAFNNLKKVLILLTDDEDLNSEFFSYMLSLVVPPLERVGVLPIEGDNEGPVEMMLRTVLLDWACTLGYDACYTTATTLFDEWMSSDSNTIVTDIQPMLYCAAVSHGGKLYHDFVLEKYKVEGISTRQQSLLLNAIACPSEVSLLNSALELAMLDTSGIREGDAATLMRRVAENSDGRQVAFDFIKTNVDAIIGSPIVGEKGISEVITALSTYFATEERLAQVQAYLETYSSKFSPTLISSIENSIRIIESNIAWMNIHHPALESFFSQPTSCCKSI